MPTLSMDVVLEGERKFRENINSINGGLRVLGSELDKTQAQFANNSKSVEALSAKNEILDRILLSQKDKVEELRKAHEKAAQAYGESDKKTMRLADQLNKAETAAIKTKNAMEKNAEAADKMKDRSGKLGDALDKVAQSLGISIPAGATKFLNSVNDSTAKAAAFGAIAIKLTTTLINASKESANAALEIKTLSDQTGLTTTAIQEYNYMAVRLGISSNTIADSARNLVNSMYQAKNGSKEFSTVFSELHIRVTKGNGELRDSNEVFNQIIDKLSKMKNETERNAYAQKLFGDQAQALIPLIKTGSAGMEEMRKAFQDAGIEMNSKTIDAYVKLNGAMKSYDDSQKALTATLGTVLLPVLTAAFNLLSKVPPDVIKIVIVIAAVVAGVIAVINVVKSVSTTVGALGKVFSLTNGQMIKTTAIIVGIIGVMTILAVAIVTITGKVNQMKDAFASAGNFTSGNIPRYASGTDFHPGGWADVGENGPERLYLPRGTKVLPNRQTMDLRRGIPSYAGGVGSFGGNYFAPGSIVIEARSVKEFNDITRIMEQQKMSMRQGFAGRV